MKVSDLEVGDRFMLPGSPDLYQILTFQNSFGRDGKPRTALILFPEGQLETWNASREIWDGQTKLFSD